MFTLNQLPKTTERPKKRRGQGYGSGKGGHTSGRGQKGQRSRGSIPMWFEGGQLPQIRRFPFVRGKRRFESLTSEVIVINLAALNKFPKDSIISPKTLSEAGLVSNNDLKCKRLKILGHGKLTVALTVTVNTSKAAAEKIVAAGGQIKSGE
jgi:large subunit ribosomal protein L15